MFIMAILWWLKNRNNLIGKQEKTHKINKIEWFAAIEDDPISLYSSHGKISTMKKIVTKYYV